MELLPKILAAINFPRFYGWEERDISKIIDPVTLTYILKQEYDIYKDYGPVKRNEYQYSCLSCMSINAEFNTSKFKVYESKQVPDFVLEEIEAHTQNHQTLGEWGISIYKQMRKNESN